MTKKRAWKTPVVGGFNKITLPDGTLEVYLYSWVFEGPGGITAMTSGDDAAIRLTAAQLEELGGEKEIVVHGYTLAQLEQMARAR